MCIACSGPKPNAAELRRMYAAQELTGRRAILFARLPAVLQTPKISDQFGQQSVEECAEYLRRALLQDKKRAQ